MSILDRFNQKFQSYAEAGVDLAAGGNSVVVVPDLLCTFESSLDGEAFTGAILTPELVHIEVGKRPQQLGGADSNSGDWFAVLENTIAAPGAKLGFVENDEFYPLPIYGDNPEFPELAGLVRQTPLMFTQILRADMDEVDRFKELCLSQGYLPRQYEGTQTTEVDLSTCPPELRESWSIEAPNRQTNDYGRDLQERIANGLQIVELKVTPPRPLAERQKPEAQVFEDFVSTWMANVDRVIMGLIDTDATAKKNARKLVSSITGTTEKNGTVYPQRATVAEFQVEVTQGSGRRAQTVTESFSFWSRKPQQGE